VRRVAIVVLIALASAGCEGNPSRTPSRPHASEPPSSGPTGTSSAPSPIGTPAQLEGIVLTANLADRPVRWPLVAHIPFGAVESRLGLYHDRQHTSTALYPPSFAVSGDQSLWILDLVKHRIAHYSPRGRYLGQVTGVAFSHETPVPRDLAFGGDDLYLLSQRNPIQGVIQSVGDAGVLPPEGVHTEGHHPAIVSFLFPSSGPVLASVNGWSSKDPAVLGSGREGVAEIVGRGRDVRFLPGYPLVDGTFMGLSVTHQSDQDMELSYTGPQHRAVRPIHVRLVTGRGGKVIPAVIGLEVDAGLPHGIVAVVGVGPASDRDTRFGDSLWLFGAFDDGSPVIWERVPEPGLTQEFFHRSITATQDGTIYRMIPEPDGIFIYRRHARP
jgi:hypothetical protein